MSYKLEKPYTEKERMNFIVSYNHEHGMQIEETEEALYALEKDEIMEGNKPVKNPEYEKEQLIKAKETKAAENKTAYESALKSGVMYKGELFDCDTLAAVRVTGQMMATQTMSIAEEDSIEWFNYNYKPVTLSLEEFMELAGLITLNTRRIETLNCGYNREIEAAQTMEELQAITINYSDVTKEEEKNDE